MGHHRNIGDQLKSVIDEAIDSNNFSALSETVGNTLSRAAREISRGIAQAQEEARRNREKSEEELRRRQAEQATQQRALAEMRQRQLEQQRAEIQRRQELAAVQYRFKNIAGMKVAGGLMAGGGIVLALAFCGGISTSLIGAALTGTAGFGISAVVMGFLAACSIGLIFAGVRKVSFANLFRKYKEVVGTRAFCNVSELAESTGKDSGTTVKALKRMLSKGMFTEGRLDSEDKILMVTKESYEQYHAAIDAQRERERRQRLVDSVTPHDSANAPLTPGQASLLEAGTAYVAKIRATNDAIPDEAVSKKIDQIELVVNKIFEYAHEHPEVIPELEKLMDYYLPTTVKLLDAYAALDAQPAQGENITSSKHEIEATLDTLAIAFEKLLDSIFRDMTWDVSTDISVLHAVLAQEGLVDGAFDQKREDGST